MEYVQQMQKDGILPDEYDFAHVLNACAGLESLEEGKRIHEEIISSGFDANLFVETSLLDMYVKCGSIDDAWKVFSNMGSRSVVAWTVMIQGFGNCGQELKALFQQMHVEGVEPKTVTFVGLLNACASIAALDEGRRIHEEIIRKGFESDVYVGSGLIDMYAKCGSIKEAWTIFRKMPKRDLAVWNAMIQGCVKCGQGLKALKLHQEMQQAGVHPDNVTFVGLVNAFASIANLEEGRRFHKQVIQSGIESNEKIGNSLIDMYAKCGNIDEAWGILTKMPTLDVVGWSAMIVGCVKSGQEQKAL